MLKVSGIALDAVEDECRILPDKPCESKCIGESDPGPAHFRIDID